MMARLRAHEEMKPALMAALADARQAVNEYENACAWLLSVASTFAEPIAVEVWVLDPTFTQVVPMAWLRTAWWGC
jgi:hypothetical protein